MTGDTLTVPQAAERLRCNAETVRRWIREGKLPARKVGTQHVIDPDMLERLVVPSALPLPERWRQTVSGAPMPDVVSAVARSRRGH